MTWRADPERAGNRSGSTCRAATPFGVPVIGEAADLCNAAIYAAEGDWTNAALAAAAIPVTGNAVAAVKMGRNAKKALDAAQAVGKRADDAAEVAKAAPPVKVKEPEPPTKKADNTKRTDADTTKKPDKSGDKPTESAIEQSGSGNSWTEDLSHVTGKQRNLGIARSRQLSPKTSRKCDLRTGRPAVHGSIVAWPRKVPERRLASSRSRGGRSFVELWFMRNFTIGGSHAAYKRIIRGTARDRRRASMVLSIDICPLGAGCE